MRQSRLVGRNDRTMQRQEAIAAAMHRPETGRDQAVVCIRNAKRTNGRPTRGLPG